MLIDKEEVLPPVFYHDFSRGTTDKFDNGHDPVFETCQLYNKLDKLKYGGDYHYEFIYDDEGNCKIQKTLTKKII